MNETTMRIVIDWISRVTATCVGVLLALMIASGVSYLYIDYRVSKFQKELHEVMDPKKK